MMLRPVLLSFLLAVCSFFASAAAPYVADSVLVIPPHTRSLPDRAFADRTDFHTVRFESPCSVSKIGEYAFMGCANLRQISLPASLVSIGEGAFRECSSLAGIEIPKGVVKLPRYVFSWCSGLRRVILPSRLNDIGSGCFAYCEALEEITFPSVLKHVGANAFSFCKSLVEVALPPSVVELESYAFSECVALRSAVLPANRNLLGELIFSGCQNLERITCGSGVPPQFDCNSTLFEDNEAFMYARCTLYVPAVAVEAYRKAHGWSLFEAICPMP